MTKYEIVSVVEVLSGILSAGVFGNESIINALLKYFKIHSKKDCDVFINSINLYVKTKYNIDVICEFNYEIDGVTFIQSMTITTKEIMDILFNKQ